MCLPCDLLLTFLEPVEAVGVAGFQVGPTDSARHRLGALADLLGGVRKRHVARHGYLPFASR